LVIKIKGLREKQLADSENNSENNSENKGAVESELEVSFGRNDVGERRSCERASQANLF
jgi:hypothetical protein